MTSADRAAPARARAATLPCQRLLSRIPNGSRTSARGSEDLQFINVAVNPTKPCDVIGGTQDNGPGRTRTLRHDHVPQIIYGDGGNAGFDSTNPTWRFNEFTCGFSDSNFRDGDPTKWVISSAPIVISGEAVAFYWPQIADPNPVAGAHPIYSGAQHVWRTWAFGAGTPGAVPRTRIRTSPSTRPTARSSRSSEAIRTAATTSRWAVQRSPTRRTTERRPAT